MSKIKVNTIAPRSGTTVTLGEAGDTISLGACAAQTGFGRTGTVDWITTPKVTGDSPVTVVSGKGYFLNTTAGTITINLPAGSAGDIVSMADYAATWQTYNVTVAANGSEKIGGTAADATLNTEGQSVTLVYVDSTQGWVNTMDSTSNVRGKAFITATGGTITTSGDDKIHTFNADGTFTVTAAGSSALYNTVSYVMVAGGGSGGNNRSGGGGGGGYRELKSPATPFTASPLDGYATPANRAIVSASPGSYPIVVGGGGAPTPTNGARGSDTTGLGITATGGGGGVGDGGTGCMASAPGGSAGGGSNSQPGGSGNTPSKTPAQGTDGGNATGGQGGGGGGGATVAGSPGSSPGGPGGAGATSSINATPTARAGGGGGGTSQPTAGTGGSGGGANGVQGYPSSTAGNAGTVNTGGGGGGVGEPGGNGGAGGSGVVILRYQYQ